LTFNEDNSAISKEAIRLRKLANKLIKEKIMDKESSIKLDLDYEKTNNNIILKNKRGNSASITLVKKEVEEAKNPKKSKLQTSTNLVTLINNTSKNKNKFNTSINLKSIVIKEDFKLPALKKPTVNKNTRPKAEDLDALDKTLKSENKKENKSKNKKIINDYSVEEIIVKKENESAIKCADNKHSKANSSSKTVNNCSKEAEIKINNSTQKQNENENLVKNDSTETQENKKIQSNEEIDEAPPSKDQNEIKEAESSSNVIEVIKVDSPGKREITKGEDKMEIDEEQAAKESIINQKLIKETTQREIINNDDSKTENLNQITNLELEAEKEVSLESENQESLINKDDSFLGNVVNEIEMAVEAEENKTQNTPINVISNNESCINTNNNNQNGNVNLLENEESKLTRNSKKSRKYLVDVLYDDIIRFNYRLPKKEGEEVDNFNGLENKLKRIKNKVDYKSQGSVKVVAKDKKGIKLPQEKSKAETLKNDLILDHEKEKNANNISIDEAKNDHKSNRKLKKLKKKNPKNSNLERLKKERDLTINLNEHDSTNENVNNKNRNLSKKTKKANINQYCDYEIESSSNSKDKISSKIQSKNAKAKTHILKLIEEDSNSQSASESEIR